MKFKLWFCHGYWVLEFKMLSYKFNMTVVILLGLVSNKTGCQRHFWAQTHGVPIPSREGWLGGCCNPTFQGDFVLRLKKALTQILYSFPTSDFVCSITYFMPATSFVFRSMGAWTVAVKRNYFYLGQVHNWGLYFFFSSEEWVYTFYLMSALKGSQLNSIIILHKKVKVSVKTIKDIMFDF